MMGARVRPSAYALRSRRDSYLSVTGPERKRREEWYRKEAAKRGVVTALIEHPRQAGLEVTWQDGTISRCLPYMVEQDAELSEPGRIPRRPHKGNGGES